MVESLKGETMIDRQEISRALGKCLAYHMVGKVADARRWASILVGMLRAAGLVD